MEETTVEATVDEHGHGPGGGNSLLSLLVSWTGTETKAMF